MTTRATEAIKRGESVFTGSMFGLLGIKLASVVLSVITLGIVYPWCVCWKESWFAKHTYINGQQLHFDGKGHQLIGKWIVWLLLTLITIGIYGLWLPVKVQAWIVKHTHFYIAPTPKITHESANIPEPVITETEHIDSMPVTEINPKFDGAVNMEDTDVVTSYSEPVIAKRGYIDRKSDTETVPKFDSVAEKNGTGVLVPSYIEAEKKNNTTSLIKYSGNLKRKSEAYQAEETPMSIVFEEGRERREPEKKDVPKIKFSTNLKNSSCNKEG